MKKFASFLLAPFVFITNYFKACVFLLIVIILIIAFGAGEPKSQANLAKLYLTGPIIDSQSFYEQVRKIKNNPQIKGVLLIINSPGGAMGASVEISDMIKSLRSKMPVVAYVQSLMASGGYYGGMYANSIVASRGALIGSIGVIFSGMNVENLMQKLGLQNQGIHAGEYKEVGTMMRTWSENERQFLTSLIQEEYQMFIEDVADARGLSVENYKSFAEGKIFSAKNALKLKLIDEIGTQDRAIDLLCEMTQVDEPIWMEKGRLEGLLDSLVEQSSKVAFSAFGSMLR